VPAERPTHDQGRVKGRPRALAVVRVADLRPSDHVLDVGCADGLISLQVAPFVERLHGLDIAPERVRRASELAEARGLGNATFEAVPIQDYPFEPLSWDVTLFMRAWGKGAGTRIIGAADFVRILGATRRQAIVQAGEERSPNRLQEILDICDDNGFDALGFRRPHLVIANRRGSDARLRELPELALVPTGDGFERVPAASLRDHPVVQSLASSAG
jgi:SAM-dependent methyltransferase